jgi:hypothetical protein
MGGRNASEYAHKPGKRDLCGFKEDMNVAGHQGIGVDGTMELALILSQQLPIKCKISIFVKDRLALVSTGKHVVQSTWEMNSWFPSHKGRISPNGAKVNS